jgi:centrosomal protein CEP104
MAMLLSYNIVSCTSEDGDHPVRELQDFHAQSRGWQSARWCDFPQALVVQFPGRVSLQQVQVLSHQFKISSRIEIFIGDMPPGVPVPVTGTDGVEYTRLGHFSLDSNERSGFQARELKTVYVPRASEGRFLKLLLHKCHVNEHNLYNQLGLLAVRAIGTGPGAIAGHGMPVQPEPISMQAQAAGPLRGEPQPSHEPPPHESPGASMDPAVI